ncbi:hypothetical protein [Sphingopyxis sp. 22461]|uniref:hypothetical protein n=1 Tax=Sphingopyxis sp. 22461 TaxID=3453923 RepID=UPI003F836639
MLGNVLPIQITQTQPVPEHGHHDQIICMSLSDAISIGDRKGNIWRKRKIIYIYTGIQAELASHPIQHIVAAHAIGCDSIGLRPRCNLRKPRRLATKGKADKFRGFRCGRKEAPKIGGIQSGPERHRVEMCSVEMK